MKLKPSPASVASSLDARFERLGPITYRPCADLRLAQRNARRHSEEQVAKLMGSISHFGFLIPVLVSPDGEIISGEARVTAAKRLGMAEVPTICVDHLSDQQIRAYRLADNRIAELASWDREVLALEFAEVLLLDDTLLDVSGWDAVEVNSIIDEQAIAQAASSDPADECPEPPKIPVSRTGDLWLLGDHRLLCGSSLEAPAWETLMDGAEAQMMFVDPPWNVPVDGHVSGLGKIKHAEFAMASGEMSEQEFTHFLATFLAACMLHLVDGAIVFVCMDHRHLFELLSAARRVGLTQLNLCVWSKANGGMGSLYRSRHELVLVFKKGKAPHINNVQLGKHGRYRTNVWEYPGANGFGATRLQDLTDHPTPKNVVMVADALRDVSHRGHIVLDAFMGSGTTLLAAERTGRIAYGVEIEPGFVDVAIRRWEQMSGREALLAATGASFAKVREERSAEALPPVSQE